MKRIVWLLWGFALMGLAPAYAQPPGWDGVENAFGRKGIMEEEMLKVTFPRSDLSVKVGEVPVEPGLALTSWIGFQRMGTQAMMMGDLVLLENEVAPVEARLVAEGVKITALHNHLVGSVPAVLYLHFSGEGNPEKLAGVMRSALAVTGTPMSPLVAKTSAPADWTKVEAIFGKSGQKKGDLLQLGFPRREQITEGGMVVSPFLGMANSITMQMVGNKAATAGDFVLTGSEVNPVVKELVNHGLTVTAIHSHMLSESPRLFFLHFWGYGEPGKLATGLKAALGKVDLAK